MKSIIITGANSGIGFECALQLARLKPNEQIILACRDIHSGNEAIDKIRQDTGHQHLICMPVDLASLQSIRDFKKALLQYPGFYISALINNAGGIFLNETQYTKDGFEMTFGTNHIGGFYLTMLLLPLIAENGSITFVSSGVHDPESKTGIAVPVYTNGLDLAHPKTSNEKVRIVAQRKYSTSKLCNVMTAYVLHEKLTNTHIRVNAYDPGQVLGTGFLRTLPAPLRFIAKNIMPFIVKKNNTPSQAGTWLANIAVAKELENLNGIYYSEGKVKKSSIDSHNKTFQMDLWHSSIELTGLKPEDTSIPLN